MAILSRIQREYTIRKKKREKKRKKIDQEHFPGGRHCRREELFCQEYIPIGTYLTLVTLIV